MAINADTLNRLVPITVFNRGQANKVFERVKSEGQLVVLKNNSPEAVILSPDEYRRMAEIVEDYDLLTMAQERLASGSEAHAVPLEEVMAEAGITQADIDAVGDVKIE